MMSHTARRAQDDVLELGADQPRRCRSPNRRGAAFSDRE